jgi:hypothetical protein
LGTRFEVTICLQEIRKYRRLRLCTINNIVPTKKSVIMVADGVLTAPLQVVIDPTGGTTILVNCQEISCDDDDSYKMAIKLATNAGWEVIL